MPSSLGRFVPNAERTKIVLAKVENDAEKT
jgi:hypothetical protein